MIVYLKNIESFSFTSYTIFIVLEASSHGASMILYFQLFEITPNHFFHNLWGHFEGGEKRGQDGPVYLVSKTEMVL